VNYLGEESDDRKNSLGGLRGIASRILAFFFFIKYNNEI
jgi:hypothetical protein